MGNLPLDRVALISIVVQTLLFGVLTTMFGTIIQSSFAKNASKNMRGYAMVLPTVSVIWTFALAHWILDIIRVQLAFIGTQPNPIAYLSDFSTSINAGKSSINLTVTLIADLFMIYRCWVVGDKSYRIILLPSVLWLAGGVAGCVLTRLLFQLHGTDYLVIIGTIAPWITTFLSSTLATNLFCTIYIAYRILRSQLAVRKIQTLQNGLFDVVIIFLESATLYSALLIILLISFQLNYNGQFIFVDSTCATIGITFSMIIISNHNRSQSQSYASSSRSTRDGSRAAAHDTPAVNVSRLVEVISQSDYELDSFSPVKHTSVV
ncbi:unnamed protein product [Mycena citricolor]|uniref:Uncharacterized protein n=1 Tax=Mycena citricolor TaxID=2018698 RepID=A0AAD2H833_9AGAR|nr:unnamed protein product [Mycena citricolor]